MTKKSRNRKSAIVDRQSSIGNCPGYPEALRAAKYIRAHSKIRPRVGIILGSGLSGVLSGLKETEQISYRKIPHFPRPSVAGHAGVLHLGTWGKVPVAVLEGRMHLYEGYQPAEVVFPTRVLAWVGVTTLILTCAAGGIAPAGAPGTFMVFRDHLNYQGANPLVGPPDARWGERFVDLSEAYDPELRAAARRAARGLGVKCFEGVYVALLGPSYETPAEIRALRRLGADAVGMSTVPEAIAARQAGLRVLAIATISNRAAGLSRGHLSHQEVLSVGKSAGRNLARLLDRLLPGLVA
ncbi:MAG TPA: purine-nucleoside phosphorylase [Terriglobia bacterium]|nr:purine-nucleoside phosphorylase [Terriglobia bacterium]